MPCTLQRPRVATMYGFIGSRLLAMAGMVVDAKDEGAASFYRHFGFVALPGQPGRLLLSAKAFPAAAD